MRYHPHTREDIARLLGAIGVPNLETLFESIPEPLRLKRELDLPGPLPEDLLVAHMRELAGRDAFGEYKSFLGAGRYPHYTPVTISQLLLRQEFFTAYTPYQPEVAQGTLRATFEFQTMTARLLGLDVANASMYDGATGLAEGALMARRIVRNRHKLVVLGGVHPLWRNVVEAYYNGLGDEIVILPPGPHGVVDLAEVRDAVDANTYAVAAQSPNFFGQVEALPQLAAIAHDAGALLVAGASEALAFALLKSPGEQGADIAAVEGQSFGVPMQYGGPGLGLFATRDEHKRQMPGRLVGKTVDAAGTEAYCLTLATREQHIRRDKATSNICTNVGLNALAACIYMTLFGKNGLRELARRNAARAEYLKQKLAKTGGVEPAFPGLQFNEVAVRVKKGTAAELLAKVQNKHKLLAGVDAGRWYKDFENVFVACVTEVHSQADIDALVAALTEESR